MHKGALRYVADSIAIEAIASDLPIYKEAGLFDSLGFSGVASSIVDKVKGLLGGDDSPGGRVKVIGNLLVSGALFKFHPLLGIVYTVANALGVDIIGIGKQVLSGVYNAVKGGANLAMSDVDQYGKIAVAKYNNGLIKEAQLFGRRRRRRKGIDIPFLPRKGGTKIERVFGNLFRVGRRGKLKTLLIAIVIWTLKTALLGAGLVGAAGLITGFIKGKKKPEEPEKVEERAEPETFEETLTPSAPTKPFLQIGPKASGRGTDVYKNDQEVGGHIWIVPLYGGVENTLAEWANDVYKEFTGYDDIIYSSTAFRSMVRKFQNNYNPGETSVMVPKGFTTRKQVVDAFAGDVFRKIKGQNE